MCCLGLFTICWIPKVDNGATIIFVKNLCATLPKGETYLQDINGSLSLGVKSGVTQSLDEEPIHMELLMLRNPDKSFGPTDVMKGVNFTVKS